MTEKKLPPLALGAWSWGTGMAGGDQVFGNHYFEDDLRPVFDKAMEKGLTLWDTAAVYGEGTSERILGNFVKLGRGLNSSPAGHEDLFNDSTIHVDFMIGTPDMKIVGTTESGEEVEIFRNGDFAI